MELFFILWLQDKRWLCSLRPPLKIFALFWLAPILCNCSLLVFNSRFLYKKATAELTYEIINDINVTIAIKTILCVSSIIACIIVIKDIYKNLNYEENIWEILTDQFKVESPRIKNKDEYWAARKTIYSCNGYFVVIVGTLQFMWDLYFYVHNLIKELKNDENYSLTLTCLMFIDCFSILFWFVFFLLICFIKVYCFVAA